MFMCSNIRAFCYWKFLYFWCHIYYGFITQCLHVGCALIWNLWHYVFFYIVFCHVQNWHSVFAPDWSWLCEPLFPKNLRMLHEILFWEGYAPWVRHAWIWLFFPLSSLFFWIISFLIGIFTPLIGSCYSVCLRDNHLCVENSMRHHCPICYEVCSSCVLHLCIEIELLDVLTYNGIFVVSFWLT